MTGRLRFIAAAAVMTALLALPRSATAVSITLAPAAFAPAVGDTFTVDVVIAGLGPVGTAPSVGAFDLALDYDEVLLDLVGVDFGLLLGDPTLGEANAEDVSGVGSVALAEVSFLLATALDAIQPDSFALATVTFKATGAGESVLSLGSAVVSDGDGRALGVSLLGSARVTAGAPAVPEPGAWLLFGGGAALVAWRTRRAGLREPD